MASKYWWRDDLVSNGASGNSQQDERGKYWWREDDAPAAAENIVSSVNAWLKKHNSYLSEYQKRYEGRKYSYEDAYVGDSSEWLNTISQKKSESDTEADRIFSYIDQYKDYLDANWVMDIKSTIAKARATQRQTIESAQKDNEYWAKFMPNEEQAAAGYTAEKVYNEWQAGQKQGVDDLAFDVEAGMVELEKLKQDRDAYLAGLLDNDSFWANIGRFMGNTGATSLGGTKTSEYDKLIAEKEAQIERAKYAQGYQSYMTNMDAEDYAANSQYVSTRTETPMEDAIYYVSYGSPGIMPGAEGGFVGQTFDPMYDKDKLFGNFLHDYINRNKDAIDVSTVNDTSDRSYFMGHDEGFLQTMTDEEIGVYNYLYNRSPEEADQFLKFIESDLEGRRRIQEQAEWAAYAKESPGASSVFSVLISPMKGLSYLGQAADMLDDGKMDKDAGYNRFSYIPSTIRSQVSSKWGKVGSFAYNTAMSMFDFLFTTAVSGGNQGLSLAIMGSGAAADATLAAKDRGLDDGQAFALGTIAGLAEVAMEKISLSAWLEGDMTEGALRYMLKNALSEGVEEAGTSVTNLLADIIIAGDKSEWKMAIQKYVDEGKSESEAFGLVLAENAAQIGLDALGGILSGAAIGGGTYAGSSIAAGFEYGKTAKDKTTAQQLVAEGIELNPDSKYVQKAQKKVEKGKNLTGMQVRNILAANQEAITPKDMEKIQKAAEAKLTELGQKENVSELARIATKWATGQELTRAEKKLITNSEYGSQVADQMLPKNIKAGDWAAEIGTRYVNAEAYNKTLIEKVKTAWDEIVNGNDPSTYKSLEERVGEEDNFSVSESGKATIRKSGVEIDLTKPKVVDFVKDSKSGKVTDMVLDVNGEQVKASEIDYADDSQSYLYSAVYKIENITPEDATVIIRDYDPSSGLTVSEYLNGMDEAFTYGYYGYSEADLKAGKFAPKLNDTMANSAYILGQNAKKNSNTNKTDAIKKMRTAVEAETQKAMDEGKEAPKAKPMTITYNDNGTIVDYSDVEKKLKHRLKDDQKSAPALAKVFHKMGLGTDFQLFESYVRDGVRFYIDENGVEQRAPSGVYRMSDGKILIDLNAYNGRGLTLDVMAHELTHFIQQWSDTKYQALADFLIKTYEKTDMSMHERVVHEQNRINKIRKAAAKANNTQFKPMSYNEAFDEVVANAMSKMLADGNVAKHLTELKAQDERLAKKLWQKLKKLLNEFLNLVRSNDVLFSAAGDLQKLESEFKQLQQMWADAFVEASENFQASRTAIETEAINSLGKNAKVETNEAGELLLASNESGNVQVYSEHTYLNGGREKLEMALRQNGHTDAEIQETLSYVDDALDYIKILAAGAAKNMGYTALSNHLIADIVTNVKTGKQVMSSIVNNGDYPVNIDLSLICKKRVAYMNLMSRLIRDGVFDKVNYDGAAIAEVNEILRENGFETACLGCFVESRRLQFQTWAETIVSEWNAEVEKRNPGAESFGFAKGKMEELTDADIDALTRELESVKKNDQGNVNLGQGNSVTKMGRLLDSLPSLQKKLTVEDLLTPEGLTALRKHDGSLFSIVKSRYGAASPKIVQDFNPYASEIAMLTFAQVKGITNNAVKGAQAYVTEVKNEYGTLTKTKGESKENFKKRKDAHEQRIQDEAMRRYLYDIGGARIQSFSDFMIENIFDYIQIFADLSAKRLPLHGYTKEIVCMRLFGMTGAKWNGSLIAHVERSMGKELAGLLPAGTKDGIPVRVNGKDYVIGFDDYARNAATNGKSFIQSIGMKDVIALMLDPRYSPYVGNITIGVSDAQILAMLDSPLFRMVIPYHASGMLPMFAKLVGVDLYNDYTDYQNTTVRQYYDVNGNAVSELKNAKGETVKADTSYAFNAEIQKTKDAKIAANNYLNWCAQRHPVYDGSTLVGYATFNPKFSSSPYGTDFTRHENYYKLLEDFNTYDCITEESSVQGSVTMNFPSEENRLGEQQMAEYKKSLRDTGIFTEKDIEKYAKKANMTFKEIIEAEVGNRASYAKAQAPKWESTVKAVEEKLQKDYAREQRSSQEMDLDTETDSAYDSAKVTKGTKQEVNPYGQDGKAEDRASFLRRVRSSARRSHQVGNITYAFHKLRVLDASNAATEARKELQRLGIKCILHNGLEYNQDGYTYQDQGNASTLADGSVAVFGKSFGDGIEFAGHEAFHVWKKSADREAYVETLNKNINITSSVYGIEQADTVLREYFGGNVAALASDEAKAQFLEELYALVSGKIHSGMNEAGLKTMFKDYAAVKAAWDDLIKKQANSEQYSSQETDRDYMDAVSRGDMETVRRMVYEAAKKAGYTTKGFHGSGSAGFTVVDRYSMLWLARDEAVARGYGADENLEGGEPYDEYGVYAMMYNLGKNLEIEAYGASWGELPVTEDEYPGVYVDEETGNITTNSMAEWAERHGYDSITFKNVDDGGLTTVDVVFNPNRDAKSSVPVTYDNDGNVIPLSQRFNKENDDIRYSSQETDADNAPVFYSQMAKVVEGMKQEKFGASSVISMLRGRGVKAEEIRWSGIHAFLDGKKSVTKDELLEFIKGSMLHIEEYELDDATLSNGGLSMADQETRRLSEIESEVADKFDEVKGLWREAYGTELPAESSAQLIANGIYSYTQAERSRRLRIETDKLKAESQDILNRHNFFGYRNSSSVKDMLHGVVRFAFTLEEKMTDKILTDFIRVMDRQGGKNFDEMTAAELGVILSYVKKEYEDAVSLDTPSAEEKRIADEWEKTFDLLRERDKIFDKYYNEEESRMTKWKNYSLPGGKNYREIVFKMPETDYSNKAMRTHWGSKLTGVMAHARIQDFDVNGKKMLFVEEIQSDWHNEGQKQGYVPKDVEVQRSSMGKLKDDAISKRDGMYRSLLHDLTDFYRGEGLDTPELAAENHLGYSPSTDNGFLTKMFNEIYNFPEDLRNRLDRYFELDLQAVELAKQIINLGRGIPDAPFHNNYHEFVLKRLLRMAAEQGYDSIGWTTADIQSDRWSDDYAEGYRIEYDQDIPKFLKKYGKQWGAEVGTTDIDTDDVYNPRYTKVWSMDITPAMKKSVLEEGQAMYSEHDTDYSNRSLLANAFEGITKDSIEYKMIQEYKGHIGVLNMLDKRLSVLNEQIRDIRFTKGKYDAEKLKEIENEREEVIGEINRYDKMLLNLEASEPLRKVIVRERQKEAKKTKEHVKEIQQNKKLRAEQAELRHKIRKTIRDLDKILNRGNKKQNVKEDLQPVVSKALQSAEVLFTDNYGSYDMLRNGIGADLSDAEEALVKSCAKMLADLDKMPTDGYENFQARQEAENRLKTKMAKLKDVFARERKRLNNTTVSTILGELADAYAGLEDSEQSYVQGAYSEPVHNFLKNLQKEVGGTVVMDMTKDQLESVYAAYTMVLTTVRKANKMFNEELKLTREQLGNAVIQEVLKAGGVHLLGTKLGDAVSQFDWNNMKPVWLANRVGSDTFGKLVKGLFKGQYNFAVDAEEARHFKLEMDKKYNPRAWDAEKLYEFESSTGKKFSLNLQQIMSLYAFSKRDQAYSHLLNGGFVFEDNSTVVVDGKLGIKKTYIHKGAASYKLSEATLGDIVNSLTAEQKAYVDEMQKYLSDVMGAKGNEVSMQLYGIKMFNEEFYFPLRSSGAYMEKAKEAEMKKQQGQINLVNSGFTHSVKPQARNPIILSGFKDVWTEHCNEMSMYHSMVLPMEDFRKVYNYSTIHEEDMESASVYQTIQDAYGKAATDYIDQLYRELNAGATVDPREAPFKKWISNFKKAAVMLSGSVVVQQFSSIGRAYALIDPKYFMGTKVNSDTKLSVVEEMKKYAPVAILKEMGGFDTITKGNAKSYIMAEQYGKGERLHGLKTDEQYRSDLMGYLPAKADELTWCAIWEAAKRETKAKNPKMDVKSEEFLKLAGERFSEVIEKTQVYDSVLARSANMRSKGNFMTMATAFMAEPTTTINLLEDAIRSGKANNIARVFGSVAVSIVLNNALASIVYAMRDDDDDETFLEKYFQSFTSGMIDDLNPMSYYPFFKDVYSLFQGYDVERSDMSVIADVRDAVKRIVGLLGKDTSTMDDDDLAEYYKQVSEVFMGLLDAGFSMFGVPVKNVRRDVNGLINAISTIATDLSGERATTWISFWDKVGAAAKDTIPILAWTKDKPKGDNLYNAIVSGDQAYIDRLKRGYVDEHGNYDESKYESAVVKALRENDPRIREAAQAGINGNSEERSRIFREIKSELGAEYANLIIDAINAEASKIRNDAEPDKVKGQYETYDFIEAASAGDANTAKAVREDIIATYVANGKTQAEAEKAFVSDVKSGINEAYSYGTISKATAKEMLMEYADMDEEDAADKITYWDFCKTNPNCDLSESKVLDYLEFAEPAHVSLEVYEQFVAETKDLADIKDEWGDVEVTKRDQVLEVIDSLPLTWQQKDALYLAAGYAESKIWDVPW